MQDLVQAIFLLIKFQLLSGHHLGQKFRGTSYGGSKPLLHLLPTKNVHFPFNDSNFQQCPQCQELKILIHVIQDLYQACYVCQQILPHTLCGLFYDQPVFQLCLLNFSTSKWCHCFIHLQSLLFLFTFWGLWFAGNHFIFNWQSLSLSHLTYTSFQHFLRIFLMQSIIIMFMVLRNKKSLRVQSHSQGQSKSIPMVVQKEI